MKEISSPKVLEAVGRAFHHIGNEDPIVEEDMVFDKLDITNQGPLQLLRYPQYPIVKHS
jgi:hypothetical protein